MLSRPSLEALGTLIAVAIERARAIEQLGKTEAAREGERLKSALLDSDHARFPHAAHFDQGRRSPACSPIPRSTRASAGELLTIINEESDRLNRLVGEAAEMARLEAGRSRVGTQAASDMDADHQRGARAYERPFSAAGRSRFDVPRICPPGSRRSGARSEKRSCNLLENANSYSSPGPADHDHRGRERRFRCHQRRRSRPRHRRTRTRPDLRQVLPRQDQRYRVQGTGMGLPIAKAIVEAHGGTISVISQLGHGSVFSFSLPAVRSQGPRP